MSDPALILLRSIDARLARLEAAQSAGQANDDGWTRIPAAGSRCPVSNWSQTTLRRHIKAGRIRSKSVGDSRFYSAADVRTILGM